MDNLAQYHWAITAGVGVIALLIGAVVRGVGMSGRVRRAEVDRDVVRTELDQARAEIDGLYMAQRRLKDAPQAESADGLKEQIKANDALIKSLGDDLARARTEIESLTRNSAATGAESGGARSPDGQSTLSDITLIWRNRYLESRVRLLEADGEGGTDTVLAAAPVPVAVGVDEPQPAEASSADEATAKPEEPAQDAPDVETEKLRWQREYLRQRVAVLEENAISSAQATIAAPTMMAAAPVPASVEDSVADDAAGTASAAPETDSGKTDADTDTNDPAKIEQELAKLRWRTRYLESRLAYFSRESEVAAADEAVETQDADEPDQADAADAEAETGPEPDADPGADKPVEGEDQPEAQKDVTAVEVTPTASDTPAVTGPERPAAINKPDTAPDDLTAIDGLEPGIADVLHELGVWSYAQIADWNEANTAWIEQQLGFDGRIAQERWIAQAGVLAAGGGRA